MKPDPKSKTIEILDVQGSMKLIDLRMDQLPSERGYAIYVDVARQTDAVVGDGDDSCAKKYTSKNGIASLLRPRMRNTFEGMKKTILLIASWGCFSLAVRAQGDKEDIRIAMALLNKQKKAIISQSIPLDEARSAKFWKLYDAYEESYNKLLTQRIGFIEQYISQYDSLTDATAATLAGKMLGNTLQLDRLHETYFARFKKTAGGTKAATLFQLELYIQTELQYRVQKRLPLIAEKMPDQ